MEPDDLLLCPQDPATGPYPKLDAPISHLPIQFP